MKRDSYTPVAGSTPFDNATNGFVADDVQAAIEEVAQRVATSASPGFTWGRSGTVTKNTWLLNDTVPSNTSGRLVHISGASIIRVYVANEDPTAGIVLGVYSHDGAEINTTLLGTVTTIAQRGQTFTVSWPVALNKQLAVKLENTSANAKNIVVGLLIAGSV